MKKQNAHLENWGMVPAGGMSRYVAPEQMEYCLVGTVTGHPKLADGDVIRSSRLETFDIKARTAVTHNTNYTLGEPSKEFLIYLRDTNKTEWLAALGITG